MHPKESYSDFQTSIATYVASLENYTEESFVSKKDEETWSLGQLFNHLHNSARNFHFKMIEKCLSDNENEKELKTEEGVQLFLTNSFPDIEIKIAPSTQYTPPQPSLKAEVKEKLLRLEQDAKHFISKIEESNSTGKMKHFIFGFLSAPEWFQLIGLHYRHHLKQKLKLENLIT
ncbi:MAG: DinB family protein [Chitinophagales bacterium]|nr:DinB family protein [Chitinophagales bacterium]